MFSSRDFLILLPSGPEAAQGVGEFLLGPFLDAARGLVDFGFGGAVDLDAAG